MPNAVPNPASPCASTQQNHSRLEKPDLAARVLVLEAICAGKRTADQLIAALPHKKPYVIYAAIFDLRAAGIISSQPVRAGSGNVEFYSVLDTRLSGQLTRDRAANVNDD